MAGNCVAYDPDDPLVTYYGTLDRNMSKKAVDDPSIRESNTGSDNAAIEDRPAWHDPIFTRVFETLKAKSVGSDMQFRYDQKFSSTLTRHRFSHRSMLK